MPFITGYISNDLRYADLRGANLKFQCPLSRATFQTRWTRSCSRSNFVSMPFITGYISNLVLLMINYRWKECFNALYHGLHFKQEKYNKIFVIKMFQCPLSRATFQTFSEDFWKPSSYLFQCPLSRATFQTQKKIIAIYQEKTFQCPLSRATFQTKHLLLL